MKVEKMVGKELHRVGEKRRYQKIERRGGEIHSGAVSKWGSR